MNENITLREWISNFDAGKYADEGRDTQCAAGWYDWFCHDSSLAAKTRKLGPKVKRIARSSKVDADKTYVFFKNNCPCVGSLYDDFRICDLDTGDVLFTITPRSGFKKDAGEAQVWGKENGFKEPLAAGTWKEVLAFFDV